jgi:hypothetical protein
MAIIFCVIFCFTAQAQASTNLMTNPGFESDFQGWIDWGNSFIDTATVHSGAKAARIGPAAGGRAQRFYDLVADTQYTMCAWSKLDSLSTPAYIGVDIYDATATRIGNHQWTVDWTTWTEESVTFIYPSNADFLNVWVWVSASSDPAYVDDFSLVEGASCEGQSRKSTSPQSQVFPPERPITIVSMSVVLPALTEGSRQHRQARLTSHSRSGATARARATRQSR